jgi:hypothetical protein
MNLVRLVQFESFHLPAEVPSARRHGAAAYLSAVFPARTRSGLVGGAPVRYILRAARLRAGVMVQKVNSFRLQSLQVPSAILLFVS